MVTITLDETALVQKNLPVHRPHKQSVCSSSECIDGQQSYEHITNRKKRQNTDPSMACSCSGCGMTTHQQPTTASQRVNLEQILQEVDDIFLLKNLLLNGNCDKNAHLSEDQKLVLLDRVQHLCQNWWVVSKEFYNLHLLYVGDENQESQEVCNLIARSQVLLVVTIGLVAVITLQVSAEPI